ncbi:MAG TPA: PCRF domain-containing protein, partial [Flexilinea sp.]|nr:PCRF domain-containing protein [Flexilinea sp.]
MLDKIDAIEARYNELSKLIAENIEDYQKTAEWMKERSDIEEIVEKGHEYKDTLKRIEEDKALEKDPEMSELASTELDDLLPKKENLENEIRSMLLPKDPRDSR